MYLRQSAILLLAASFACLDVNAFIQTSSLGKRSFITSKQQQEKTQFAVLFSEAETPAAEADEETADAAPVAEISEEAAPAADGEEEKPSVERERFTLFVGNLPFSKFISIFSGVSEVSHGERNATSYILFLQFSFLCRYSVCELP